MQAADISVELDGRCWAIKHNGGFLGHVRSEAEAWRLVQSLVDQAPPAPGRRHETSAERQDSPPAAMRLLAEPVTAAAWPSDHNQSGGGALVCG
jgi:hypothetical protein